MHAPTVSVVIPTYNYAHFVTEAVDSVLGQTCPADEVIVVDDGSTDDTRERLRAYGDRIRYVYQPNQGLSAARNTGICAARGEWVALLDSDDTWHPRKQERQAEALRRHPDVSLLATGETSDVSSGWPELGAGPPEVRPVTLEELAVRSRFGSSGVLVRKTCFDAVGLFDTTLRSAEDRDMWIRIASRFPVACLKEPLWWYRPHGDSMSRAAVRMEVNELKVLRNAFASIEALRRDYLLRLRVFSHASKAAAYRYESAGMRRKALARVLWSLALWPYPHRSDVALTRFERPKMLVLFVLRVVRSLFRREVNPGAGPAGRGTVVG
jgi:glycosyltransferase involved in cell wall biosynthesis